MTRFDRPFVVDEIPLIGDMSSINGSMKNHILSQQNWCFNHVDVSCGNCFINRHTLYQFIKSNHFNEINLDAENCDVSGGHGSMNSHTLYQNNGLQNWFILIIVMILR